MLFLIRILPLSIGAVALVLSYFSWTFGEPPTWMQFGPRAETEVLATRIDVRHVGNGSVRYVPVVDVAWPDSSEGIMTLGDVQDVFEAGPNQTAKEALDRYKVGAKVQVRVFEGRPYADRLNWFQLAHAVLALVVGLPLFVMGCYWLVAFGPPRRA